MTVKTIQAEINKLCINDKESIKQLNVAIQYIMDIITLSDNLTQKQQQLLMSQLYNKTISIQIDINEISKLCNKNDIIRNVNKNQFATFLKFNRKIKQIQIQLIQKN